MCPPVAIPPPSSISIQTLAGLEVSLQLPVALEKDIDRKDELASIEASLDNAVLAGSALDSMLELEYEEMTLRMRVETIARDRQAMPKYLVNVIGRRLPIGFEA